MHEKLERTPYQEIGGELAVKALVERFYDLMSEKKEASVIRLMHAKSLRVSREKLFLFLSGWLGGPDLYIQKYGHPRLRARHLPFAIGEDEKNQWLMCMNQALDEQVEEKLRMQLKKSFSSVANHMINK